MLEALWYLSCLWLVTILHSSYEAFSQQIKEVDEFYSTWFRDLLTGAVFHVLLWITPTSAGTIANIDLTKTEPGKLEHTIRFCEQKWTNKLLQSKAAYIYSQLASLAWYYYTVTVLLVHETAREFVTLRYLIRELDTRSHIAIIHFTKPLTYFAT